MKKYLTLIIALVSLSTYAQINYENGYFINNNNERIDCLIKNAELKNNPTTFDYKLSENSEQKTLHISSVKEFGVKDAFRYIKSTVDIDKSSEKINKISNDKNPIFNKETLFLKVLIQGNANLYSYQSGDLMRFFYNVGDSEIKQLVYKSYTLKAGTIGKNNRFKQQLLTDLECEDMSLNDVKNLSYNKNKLVKLFVKYNTCSKGEFKNYETKEKVQLVKLAIRPGVRFSSLSIENNRDSAYNTDFDSEIGFRIGLEAEFTLPFNKNKWAIIIEPTYQSSYKSEKEITYIKTTFLEKKTNVKVNYSSIDFPVGLRYYSFLNDKSKLFFNISVAYNVPLSGYLYAEDRQVIDLEFSSRFNTVFGAGYKYNDKFSLEVRLQTRQVIRDYVYWNSKYPTTSLVLGYKLF